MCFFSFSLLPLMLHHQILIKVGSVPSTSEKLSRGLQSDECKSTWHNQAVQRGRASRILPSDREAQARSGHLAEAVHSTTAHRFLFWPPGMRTKGVKCQQLSVSSSSSMAFLFLPPRSIWELNQRTIWFSQPLFLILRKKKALTISSLHREDEKKS